MSNFYLLGPTAVPHERQVPVSDVTPRWTVIVTIGSRALLNYLMMMSLLYLVDQQHDQVP